MPSVTNLKFWMEDRLKEKLDMMIARMSGGSKRDNLVLIDGDEGDGKSTMAAQVGYYIHYETKRPYTLDNLFFNLEELMTFALNTKEQIIIWDEGALGGLAGDWWNKHQKKFLKLLMVARKRRHFFIICIPKFFKMNEYLVLDRSIALIHVYSRKQIEQGKYVYFNKIMKERLYYDWRKSRYRNYRKYYNFHGSFPNVFAKIFDEDAYDKKKDMAILSIDKEDDKLDERSFRKNLSIGFLNRAKLMGIDTTQENWAKILNVSLTTYKNYRREAEKLRKGQQAEGQIISKLGVVDFSTTKDGGNQEDIVKQKGVWLEDKYVFNTDDDSNNNPI